MGWLNQLLTGRDNQSHDIGRWSWVVSLLTVIGAAISNMVHAGVIDLIQLSGALSAVAGAHGVAIMAKKETEPGADK